MADLGKLQGETYLSRKDARWIVQAFRELAPQVRNLGGVRMPAGRATVRRRAARAGSCFACSPKPTTRSLLWPGTDDKRCQGPESP